MGNSSQRLLTGCLAGNKGATKKSPDPSCEFALHADSRSARAFARIWLYFPFNSKKCKLTVEGLAVTWRDRCLQLTEVQFNSSHTE